MALDPVYNFCKVQLAFGYDSSATSIELLSGEGAKLPSPTVLGNYNLVWWNYTDYPDPSDDPNKEIIRVTGKVVDILAVTRAQEGTLASAKNISGKTYKMILTPTKKTIGDIGTELDGKDEYHGVQTIGALSFDNTDHILTIASGTNTYWFNGVSYTTASAITCDIDSYETLTDNTQYYFYFDDASGTLKCSDTSWNLNLVVPVATVYWNGSAGSIIKESHGYKRDIAWHIWAHLTVGARISPSDFAMTAPSVASPTTVAVAGGTLYDEDLVSTFSASTNCRVWYQVSASKYTWVASNSIYPTNVRFVNSATYALTDLNVAQYINMWVYASPDIDRPIYSFVETKATAGYNTVAQARAANPPTLSGLGLTPELKLLYRVILKGDETFAEATDYRASSSLPAGGSSAPTASSVTFTPTLSLTSTSVQGVVAELFEKVYPVGSVYTNKTDSTNPATLFGFGTWVAIAGRVVVGLDAGQTEFDTAGETGGAKTHTLQTTEIPAHSHGRGRGNDNNLGGGATQYGWQSCDDYSGTYYTDNAGGGQAHNNLQPYVVCYVWERTA